MTQKRIRAFIAAQANVDTGFVRATLLSDGVVVDDAFSVVAGDDIVKALLRRIRSADVVIAVIGDLGWTAYEIGIADALGKPVLVIAPPGSAIPSVIGSRQVLRVELVDSDILRLTIRKFLDEARYDPARVASRASRGQRKPKSSTRLPELVQRIRDARSAAEPLIVEELALEVLQAAGVSVAAQEPHSRDRGVDFAVWADALSHVIGGPLLVEVKAGAISPNRLREAESRILHAMGATGSRLGLVLYLDREHRRYSGPTWEMPYVIRFDLEDFATTLIDKSFADLIVEQRNRLVHGVG